MAMPMSVSMSRPSRRRAARHRDVHCDGRGDHLRGDHPRGDRHVHRGLVARHVHRGLVDRHVPRGSIDRHVLGCRDHHVRGRRDGVARDVRHLHAGHRGARLRCLIQVRMMSRSTSSSPALHHRPRRRRHANHHARHRENHPARHRANHPARHRATLARHRENHHSRHRAPPARHRVHRHARHLPNPSSHVPRRADWRPLHRAGRGVVDDAGDDDLARCRRPVRRRCRRRDRRPVRRRDRRGS